MLENAATEADCDKEAWLGVNKPNELGGLSNKYDTLRFELNKNYSTSGAVLGSAVQWPVNGEFKGDVPIEEISASKNAGKIIGSTVTCENAKEGKNIFTAWKNCEPLHIGSPSSSSSSSVVGQSGVIYGSPVTYEGETYQTVVIGSQTWFARNLNYAPSSGTFISCDTYDCATYGAI